MKKVYYIDLCLIIISLILLLMFIKNIAYTKDVITLIVFLMASILVNYKLRIVRKNPPSTKLSTKEKIDSFLLLLGKVFFLLEIISTGFYSDNALIGVLAVFLGHSYLILNYSYLHNDYLIRVGLGPISLKNIRYLYIDRKFIDQVYLNITTNEGKSFKCCMSQKEYILLGSIKSS